MPDLDGFDLDAAFRDLEHDIAGISSPRGAGRAVATARRRRRTTIGAVAAVAVLAVGGAVIGQGLHGGDHSVGPAGLPAPVTFDAATLDAATAGWTAGWVSPRHGNQVSMHGFPPPCLGAFTKTTGASVPPEERIGGPLLVSPRRELAFTSFHEWGATRPTLAATIYSEAVADVDACARAAPAGSYTWGADGDGSARSWSVAGQGSQVAHIWVVREGRAVGFLVATGSAGDVPRRVDKNVATLLVGGLQSPASYAHTLPGRSSSGTSSSSSPASFVSTDAFAQAVAGWDTGWSATNGDAPGSLPCEVDLSAGQQFGSSTDLGANGDQTLYGYASAAAASEKLSSLAGQLRGCPPNDVRQVPLAGGGSVLVSSAVGSGQQDVWVVQRGRTLAVIQVPAGGSAAPEAVDAAVAKLLVGWLDSQ